MTDKPLPIPYCSRNNSRENRDTSRHRSLNKFSFSRPASPNYNRDGNRSRRPFSRNRL